MCVDSNAVKYSHSRLQHVFSGEEDDATMPQAFFKFTLKTAINPKEHAFAISVQQQGERLKNYRLTDSGK